jgi:hypothetical protein
MGTLVGKLAALLDMAARCAVGVVSVLLIREFWGEPESNSDGPPVQLLIPPLIAYIGWNTWVMTRSTRRWISGSLGDSSFLASLGVLSLVRLVWLIPLADDWWWHYRERLMVLIVMSVATAVLALGAATRLATASSSAVEDDARSDDQNDPLGSSPKHA